MSSRDHRSRAPGGCFASEAPGEAPVRTEPIAGDASTRRYDRQWFAEGRTTVLATYPPGSGRSLERDVEVLRWLANRGLRVPSLHEVRLDRGELVLEDFGEEDAEATLRRTEPSRRLDLVERLLQPLGLLANLPLEGLPGDGPRLDEGRLRWELAGFELWFQRTLLGRRPDAETDSWLDRLARAVSLHPLRVCHRDFHLNNLFILPDDSVGVIDVQDLLLGPESYDAVSMVGERAFPELLEAGEATQWAHRWASSTGAAPGWQMRFPEARLQRGLKVLGTFARLAAAGRPGYLKWTYRLSADLAREGEKTPLPQQLRDLLLHWGSHGGGDDR